MSKFSITFLSFLFLYPLILLGQAVPNTPALPTSVPPSTRPATTGTVFNFTDTGNATTNTANLISNYAARSCGDEIRIPNGTQFALTTSLIFNKPCSAPNWFIIDSVLLVQVEQ